MAKHGEGWGFLLESVKAGIGASMPPASQFFTAAALFSTHVTVRLAPQAEAWLLWAKAASACGANLTVTCVLNNAAAVKDWDAGGIEAPIPSLTLSNKNPQPSPCFAILKLSSKGINYDKAITKPTQSIWNCNPKNVVQLTAQQQQQLNSL